MNTSFLSLGAATKSQVFICSMKLHASSWSQGSILKILVVLFIFLIVLTMFFRVNSKPAHRGNIIPDTFLFFLVGTNLKKSISAKEHQDQKQDSSNAFELHQSYIILEFIFLPVVFFSFPHPGFFAFKTPQTSSNKLPLCEFLFGARRTSATSNALSCLFYFSNTLTYETVQGLHTSSSRNVSSPCPESRSSSTGVRTKFLCTSCWRKAA